MHLEKAEKGVFIWPVSHHESSLESACHRVEHDTPRDEEGGEVDVHAGEGVHGGGSAEQEHRGDDDRGEEGEYEEGDVGRLSPPDLDQLAHGVGLGRLALDFDGDDPEKEHLDGGARRVPERACTVVGGCKAEHMGMCETRRFRGCRVLNGKTGKERERPRLTRDAIGEGDVGRLEESSCPRPLADDDSRGETSLDGASRGVELLTVELGAL